jgi:hypothetical protein
MKLSVPPYLGVSGLTVVVVGAVDVGAAVVAVVTEVVSSAVPQDAISNDNTIKQPTTNHMIFFPAAILLSSLD